MEASEKPQLPLEPDRADGAVRAIDDRLVIERLEVNDAAAARVVREQAGRSGHQPAETVTRAIEIGARVIESEGTAANVDYVRARARASAATARRAARGVIEEGQRGVRGATSPAASTASGAAPCSSRSARC